MAWHGSEEAVLRSLLERLALANGPAPEGDLWAGDDGAVVGIGGRPVVLSTDVLVEGVHFDLRLSQPGDVGWKAVTAAVSDIAAMGARPVCCLVTECLPAEGDLRSLTEGVAEATTRYRCPVVGGDLSAAGELAVSVAVVGVLDALPDDPPGTTRPALTRAGARPGDTLFVTGPCGASAAGLRLLGERRAEQPRVEVSEGVRDLARAHLRPVARLAEGRAARRAGASAMIDVSDGLGLDLDRLAAASGVGVHLASLPVADGATEEEALAGGEDFELLIATPRPAELVEAFDGAGLSAPVPIGRCTSDTGERRLGSGRLPAAGWRHAF